MTKLSSSLPKEIEENGLLSVNRELIDGPQDGIYIVARIVCQKVTKDMFTGAETATAMITDIEPMHGREADAAEKLLRDANERRVPRPEPLPGVDQGASAPVFSIRTASGFHGSVSVETGEIFDEGDDDD